MRKDPTEFRERFKRWKEGLLVYKNGKPTEDEWDPNDTYTADAAMIKSKIAIDSHFGNPTMRRIANYDGRDYTFPNQYDEVLPGIYEPRRGNVYIGSTDEYAVPSIQDIDGQLLFVEQPRINNQSIKFPKMRDAWAFGENYKKYAPMMKRYVTGYEDGKMPKYGDGLTGRQINDSTPMTVIKTLDPTGISSYGDVYYAYDDFKKDPSVSNLGALAIETAGAIPIFGKLAKGIKAGYKAAMLLKSPMLKYSLNLLKKYTDDILNVPGWQYYYYGGARGANLIKDIYDNTVYEVNEAKSQYNRSK